MLSLLGRAARIRWMVGVAGLVVCLVTGTGAAQAAGIGNALHPVFNQRPVLDHINILNGVNAGRAQFCFDKSISLPNPGNPQLFRLGGYRWDTFLSGATGSQAVLDATGRCAIVTMTPGNPGASQFQRDLYNYTIGTVDASAVTANQSGGSTNRADSAPNVDSVTHNGTRGHTTGFDLQSIVTGSPAGTNEIIYVGDQPIDPTTISPGNFCYYDSSGNIFCGVTAQVSNDPNGGQSFVRVQFVLPSGQTTQSAAVAFIYHGMCPAPGASSGGCPNGAGSNPPNGFQSGGQDNSPEPATYAPTLSVDNPACAASSCATVRPKLVSSEISGSNTMDFTFDQNVSLCGAPDNSNPSPPACTTNNATQAAKFLAVTSNGDETTGTSATVLTSNPNTVRVTFSGGTSGTDLSNYLEEVVVGSVDEFAVISSNNVPSFPAGKPAGDNASGQAPGYTNAPDATTLTLLRGTGQMIVTFDQRIQANAAGQPVGPVCIPRASPHARPRQSPCSTTTTPLGDWIALDANGNPVATPTSATVEHIGPFLDQVRLGGFNPVLIDQGVIKALEIVGNQYCSNGSAAQTTDCGTTPGDPNSFGFVGQSSEPNAPSPATSAVFTFGTPHFSGDPGMNPAGNVQQILAPNSTQSIARLLSHGHWVKVTKYRRRHRR